VTIDDQPWFAVQDVCRMIGLDVGPGKSTTRFLAAVGPAEKRTVSEVSTLGIKTRAPRLVVVSEQGLYTLVLRAQKTNPKAREFQNWVTGTVLSAIPEQPLVLTAASYPNAEPRPPGVLDPDRPSERGSRAGPPEGHAGVASEAGGVGNVDGAPTANHLKL